MNFKNRLCKFCDIPYQPNNSNQKYCSTDCLKKSMEKPCEYCDTIFIPDRRIQKYCSIECGQKGRKFCQDESMNYCCICKKCKLKEEFPPNYYGRCIICTRERDRLASKTPHGRYRALRKSSRKRGLEMTIPEIDYLKIIQSGICSYCFGTISETGVALDRKDNKLGYTIENVVLCCGTCNKLRMDWLSYEEMLMLSPVLKEIRILRNQKEKQ